ncbi:SDR family oxidoreductase [Legionella pneumophila]|uniref:SDR family oxidoreductase n=1 Tax=Legionella pneumophila TaxID=446 RepID=UPI00101E2EAA|nr:SDR family oxidoreductase [Legionella pneumophila]RYW88253.1 SDR family oxidoreductase [Legionella pneumophila]
MGIKKSLIMITGASSGIGGGIADIFSENGYPLLLISRNITSQQHHQLPNTLYFQADVTDPISLSHAIKEAEIKFGPVECLINNAGTVKNGEFSKLSHHDHEQMVDVNVKGVINCIEAVLPGMQSRKTGTIINISSLADRKTRPKLATYAATKAAIKSLSESLRMANASLGIRVCNIAPAKVKTSLLQQSNLQENQIISVAELAKAVLWIYEQPQHICIRDIVIAPTYYED